jgi:NADPH:quinone reductase-like Zn-dependent oxidoreductase
VPEEYIDNKMLGYDISGIIEEVGGESSFKVGDEFFASFLMAGMNYGALAEYVVCNTAIVGKRPSNIRYDEKIKQFLNVFFVSFSCN